MIGDKIRSSWTGQRTGGAGAEMHLWSSGDLGLPWSLSLIAAFRPSDTPFLRWEGVEMVRARVIENAIQRHGALWPEEGSRTDSWVSCSAQ